MGAERMEGRMPFWKAISLTHKGDWWFRLDRNCEDEKKEMNLRYLLSVKMAGLTALYIWLGQGQWLG